MQIAFDEKTVTLKNNLVYTYALSKSFYTVSLTHDIQSIRIDDLPKEILEVRVLIGKFCMAIFKNDGRGACRCEHTLLSDFPIYTSLCRYCDVDVAFVFAEAPELCTPVEMTREEKEFGDKEVTVFDGYEYHTGKIVTYKTVKYMGWERQVTIPKIVVDLMPADVSTGLSGHTHTKKVPVRQLIQNIDPDFKKKLEEKKEYGLVMVDDTSGYVTNYIQYRDGLAGLMFAF